MKATVEFVSERFDTFNRLCFGGELQPLPIRLSYARTFLGKVTCLRERIPGDCWHYHSFTLRISALKDMPEEMLEDTILHEMIHYWILSRQLQDSSVHGHLFRAKMHEINACHGRHITVSHRMTSEDHDADTQLRHHLVCVTRLSDGCWGVTVAARSRLFRLWDAMPRFGGVTGQWWISTTDPYFNRFPRALTPKIYSVRAAELQAHLAGARPLVREGSRIMVSRQPLQIPLSDA